ncbi:DUF3846 domain-containing protein [Parafrankia discariae]|uniref:DUF3846 domain-containing protein n=1 Tax=Parafrankia discariae TaxID=365528 RepID=UPI0003AB48B8|nr:DUF3846 domain-containing protein [Parafrankia discariae]
MIIVLVIPAAPTAPIHRRRLDPADIPAMERIVGGGLHPVSLTDPESSLYLPAPGPKTRPINRPLNERATALAAFHIRPFQPQRVLRGDAILTGPTDEDGQDTDAPDDLIRILDSSRVCVRTRNRGDRRWSSAGDAYPGLCHAYIHTCKAVLRIPVEDRPLIRIIAASHIARERKGNQP